MAVAFVILLELKTSTDTGGNIVIFQDQVRCESFSIYKHYLLCILLIIHQYNEINFLFSYPTYPLICEGVVPPYIEIERYSFVDSLHIMCTESREDTLLILTELSGPRLFCFVL